MKFKSINEIDYYARCYVQGTKKHSKTGDTIPVAGGWHARFMNHPWVRASLTENWDSDLRAHVVMEVKLRMMSNADYGEIEKLMPDGKWVEAARVNAARYNAAAEFQNAMAEKHGTFDKFLQDTRRQRSDDGAGQSAPRRSGSSRSRKSPGAWRVTDDVHQRRHPRHATENPEGHRHCARHAGAVSQIHERQDFQPSRQLEMGQERPDHRLSQGS